MASSFFAVVTGGSREFGVGVERVGRGVGEGIGKMNKGDADKALIFISLKLSSRLDEKHFIVNRAQVAVTKLRYLKRLFI